MSVPPGPIRCPQSAARKTPQQRVFQQSRGILSGDFLGTELAANSEHLGHQFGCRRRPLRGTCRHDADERCDHSGIERIVLRQNPTRPRKLYFGWPTVFPVRYLWSLHRWEGQCMGAVVEPRKRPHCLMCFGYGETKNFKIKNALFRECWTRTYELQRHRHAYRWGWHHVKAKSCH
jgi:hypothetical protein